MRVMYSALIGMALGTATIVLSAGAAQADGGVCYQPMSSIEFTAINQAANALRAKGCGPGDIFVTSVPDRIRGGLSLVAASFCDYRGAIAIHDAAGGDTADLSCVLTTPRQPRTSR